MCPLTTFLFFDFSQIKAHSKIGPKGEGRNKDGDRTTLGPSVHPPIDLSLLILTATAGGAKKRKAKAKKESRCCEAFQVYNTKDTLARERERGGGPLLMMQNLWRVLLLAAL